MIPTAEKIIKAFRSGSSLPVLAETDTGVRCVIKWNGAGDGVTAHAVDWVALQCARHCGIRVPQPHRIMVTADLADPEADPEINELIMRSIGTNLGIEYFEKIVPFTSSDSVRVADSLKHLIYCYDVLLLNMDRIDVNPNMIFVKDELYCLDFSAAMGLKMLIDGSSFSERTFFPLLRRHPFYTPSSDLTIPAFPVSRSDIHEIVESMPVDWLVRGEKSKPEIIDGLLSLFGDSRSIIAQRTRSIDAVPLESPEERTARLDSNLKAFETVVRRYQ
jgi:hypothetical protein